MSFTWVMGDFDLGGLLDELPGVAILAVEDHVDDWGGFSNLCEVDAEYILGGDLTIRQLDVGVSV
jgi:hypothetical protein